MHSSTSQAKIIRVRGSEKNEELDMLAAEEPLEIRLLFGTAEERRQQSVSVTMRTPGSDFELATGFLFTEGIIRDVAEVSDIKHCGGLNNNVVRVELNENTVVDITKLERNFYTTSSCGVCGKASIDAVRTVRSGDHKPANDLRISMETLIELPAKLREAQSVFDNTGGLHGCAFFDHFGALVLSREDVGRHNAVDKLIGASLQQKNSSHEYILLLSGRASFELIQKAWMAGVQIVAAVGAPSSLAVEMATDANMTLVGFLRNGGFNIYCGQERIISKHEDPDQG